MPKLCKDCRWALDPTTPGEQPLLTRRSYDWRCQHPTSLKQRQPDYVLGQTGDPYPDFCNFVRDDPRRCGPEGSFWEQREDLELGFGPPE